MEGSELQPSENLELISQYGLSKKSEVMGLSSMQLKAEGVVNPLNPPPSKGPGEAKAHVEHHNSIFDMKVLGDRIFTAGPAEVIVWDSELNQVASLDDNMGWVNGLAVDEKENLVITGSQDGKVRVFDGETLHLVKTIDGDVGEIDSLHLVDDELYVGGTGLSVFNVKTWEQDYRLRHSSVDLSPSDYQKLKTLSYVSAGRGRHPAANRKAGRLRIKNVAANKPYIFSSTHEGGVWVWDAKAKEVERTLECSGGSHCGCGGPVVVATVFDAKTKSARLKLCHGCNNGVMQVSSVY